MYGLRSRGSLQSVLIQQKLDSSEFMEKLQHYFRGEYSLIKMEERNSAMRSSIGDDANIFALNQG
jgi:hypothetical protein